MKQVKIAKDLIYNRETQVTFEDANTCPRCHTKISPMNLSNYIYRIKNREIIFTAINYCTGCDSIFLSNYDVGGYTEGFSINYPTYLCSEPLHFIEEKFEECIRDVSPTFVEIFNQSLAAESSSLDQIAGIGYRKALEFLVKDFLISEDPSNSESIKKASLGHCINTELDNQQLRIAASRASWLGNDHTHYDKKFEDKDINDLKRLIRLTVHWVSMILETKETEKIEPRK